jgi:hypothetical protein
MWWASFGTPRADGRRSPSSRRQRIVRTTHARHRGRWDGGAMRKIGYARVSSTGQNLDHQLGALVAESCDRLISGSFSYP